MKEIKYTYCKDCDLPALPCKAECLARHREEQEKSKLTMPAPGVVLQLAVWVQMNAPILFPLFDRLLHLFGGCIGH